MIEEEMPWVSFCMSTYKRPELLKRQLHSLSQQSFTNFEVVISDNDPENSGEEIVKYLNDQRFRYFSNGENLGMMQSFNLSIERAKAEYIVMITDDDPVEKNFLSELFEVYSHDNNHGIYAGFLRKKIPRNKIEYIKGDRFAEEILNPSKTERILWSSCIIRKNIAIEVGKIPDYGSPHLADHAFIVMTGSIKGGIIKNKMYSTFASHNTNFSKSNLLSYPSGCKGFYETLNNFYKNNSRYTQIKKAINKHLKGWFITSIFTLKKYYTVTNKNKSILQEIDYCAQIILQLYFMKHYKVRYHFKQFIFSIKKKLNLL